MKFKSSKFQALLGNGKSNILYCGNKSRMNDIISRITTK